LAQGTLHSFLSLPWLDMEPMAQKYLFIAISLCLFIAILCAKMPRVNKAYLTIAEAMQFRFSDQSKSGWAAEGRLGPDLAALQTTLKFHVRNRKVRTFNL